MVKHARILKSASFDHIVIGCGTAGSIVVSRLSAAEFKVLVLERGNNISWSNPIITEPKTWTSVSDIQSVEWGYESIPQKHLKDRIIKLSAAKALGGCQVVFSLELKQLH